MALTIQDLKDRIIQTYDPNDFLERFSITTEDLVNLFEDFLIDNYDSLVKEFETETEVFDGSEES